MRAATIVRLARCTTVSAAMVLLTREAVDFDDALHPRDNEGKFRTVFNRVNKALSAWSNGGSKDGERPISSLKLSRPSLMKVARKMGYEPKRGESDESIEDGILAKAREIDANRGEGAPVNKRVVLTDAQHELLDKASKSESGVIGVDKSDPDVKALADAGYIDLDPRGNRAEITGRGELKLKLPRKAEPAAPDRPAAKKAAPRLSAADREKRSKAMVRDYESGMSISEVAEKHGVSTSAAHDSLTKAGTQLRPRGGTAKKAAPKAKPERPSTVAELEAELDSLSTPAQKRARLRKYGYTAEQINQMVPLKAKGAPKTKAAKQQFLADLIDAELAKPGLNDRAVTGAASPRELLKDLSARLRAGEDDFENGWRAVADHMAVRYGGNDPISNQITDAFARIDAAYTAQVPTRAPRMPRAPLRERPPAKPVPPRPRVELSPKAQSTMGRLQSFDNPPSRPEAHELLKDMSRDDLKAMAEDLSVPKASNMSMAKLRAEIVEATAGRRLDSISIRGFRGRAPGDDGPKA
jgi:transposase-like protein